MQAFREFKAAWDPAPAHEPGQARRPVPRRRAPAPRAAIQAGHARTPDSRSAREVGDGFARAVGHCVGMGKCRASKGGTMCPSYRATREERYSTRGRARLLGEMLRGEVITDGWKSEEVKEALDWCLGCKGCRSDCPTHTDMAAYKAEFLSHYYEGRLRPRQAWSMGRIGEWAPLASTVPWRRECRFRHRPFQARRRRGARALVAEVRRTDLSRELQIGKAGRAASCCSTTRSTTTSARQTARGGAEACSRRGLRGRAAARARVLRPAVLRLRHARARQVRARAGARCARAAARARTSGGGARAGLPLGIPRRAAPALPRRRARRAAREARRVARRIPEPQRLSGEGARARCWCTRIATRKRSGAAATTSTLLRRRGLRGRRRPTPAAAACRARSATARVLRDLEADRRARAAAGAGGGTRRRRWWRAGFPAASRSRASPAGRRCTLPSCSPAHERRARPGRDRLRRPGVPARGLRRTARSASAFRSSPRRSWRSRSTSSRRSRCSRRSRSR